MREVWCEVQSPVMDHTQLRAEHGALEALLAPEEVDARW